MKRRNTNHNHARVKIYKVTYSKEFNNFLLPPDYLFEDKINYAYPGDDGKEVMKEVPTKVVGPHLKLRKFFYRDDDLRSVQFKGMAYEIPADVIFNYKV